jgi:hypothetical protein
MKACHNIMIMNTRKMNWKRYYIAPLLVAIVPPADNHVESDKRLLAVLTTIVFGGRTNSNMRTSQHVTSWASTPLFECLFPVPDILCNTFL